MNNADQTILITGGTGFAGWHLVEHLLTIVPAEQIHVTYITHIPEEAKGVLPEANFHKLDMTVYEDTEGLLKTLQPTQMYHLASIPTAAGSFEHAQEVLSNNINLQLHLLKILKEHLPSTRVLMVASADTYGTNKAGEVPITEDHPLRPVNPYGVSKGTQELLSYAYGQAYNLPLLLVRPFNHIGERQMGDFAVPSFARQIVAVEKGEQPTIKVGNLEAVRDFTDVKDMVKAYALVMEKGVPLNPYNLGSGTGVKMQELMDMLISLSTTKITLETDPDKIRPLDIPEIIANNEKIRELGWKPEIPLKDTLERVLAYWRSQ